MHRAVTSDSFGVGRSFISPLPSTRTLRRMARLPPTGWLALLFLSGAAALTTAIPAAGEPSCLPPPNLLITQAARMAGTSSPVWADLQAAAQRDAFLPTAADGQVVRDELAAINRDGYQWDCVTSRLLTTSSATSPTTSAAAGRAAPASRAAQSVPTASPQPSEPGSRAATPERQSGSALNKPSNSSAGNEVAANIPTILIVVGLMASAGAVVFAVRHVNR